MTKNNPTYEYYPKLNIVYFCRSILQMHMTRHTGKLCKCPEDGCVFAARTPAELKAHLLTHSDAKPFTCSHCQYKGKSKQQLERYVYYMPILR